MVARTVTRIADDRREHVDAPDDDRRGHRRDRQQQDGEHIPAGVDPEVEDPASQLADAGPTVGESGRDECRARQCEGVKEDERSNAGQIEVDDADAGKGQQRQREDRRAGPVGDGEEDGKWVPSGDGAHLLGSFGLFRPAVP